MRKEGGDEAITNGRGWMAVLSHGVGSTLENLNINVRIHVVIRSGSVTHTYLGAMDKYEQLNQNTLLCETEQNWVGSAVEDGHRCMSKEGISE